MTRSIVSGLTIASFGPLRSNGIASVRTPVAALAIVLALTLAGSASAQEPVPDPGAKAPSAAEANNPLAKFQAFNVHNYYVPAISELDGQNSNAFWLRYAQPFGKWLFRASLPVARVPTADSKTVSGLGDANAFAAYLFDTGNPSVSVGVGPQITIPTGSETETGTGRWLGGFAATFFDAMSCAQRWDRSGLKAVSHVTSSSGWPSTPLSSVLMKSTATLSATVSSGKAPAAPVS